jgi:hypothetical protein
MGKKKRDGILFLSHVHISSSLTHTHTTIAFSLSPSSSLRRYLLFILHRCVDLHRHLSHPNSTPSNPTAMDHEANASMAHVRGTLNGGEPGVVLDPAQLVQSRSGNG